MKKIEKILIAIIILLFAWIFNNVSYAVTPEKAGQAMANFADNFYKNYAKQSVFSNNTNDRTEAYLGLTINGQYRFDNVSWLSFVIHQSLGIGDDTRFNFFAQPPDPNHPNFQNGKIGNGFHAVDGVCSSNGANIPCVQSSSDTNKLKPGDILFCGPTGPHAVLYIGNGQIIHMTENGLKKENLFDNSIIGSDKKYQFYFVIVRITEDDANSIQEGNIVEVFDGEYLDEYGRYYGTTEGRYVGSYNILGWLFNQFVGFMDYLFGIMAYIIRAPFVGWANIVENFIDDTFSSVQGIKVQDVGNGMEVTEEQTTIEDREKNSIYKPSANDKLEQSTVDTSNRINIEDVVYNNIPILDVDIFDIYLDKFVSAGKVDKDEAASSPVVLLRKNIAIWYYIIRNVSIVVMLLILLYLGIRVSIATVGDKKAQFKELMEAWVVGFAVMFLIHFFMITVVDVNSLLVDTFHKTVDSQLQGSTSLYDTVRTRAYSFKLSEGVPATIIYMVLIYFLIRFLGIYIRRYFKVNILALMGPIIGAKYAFDKIQKGKTSSLSNWMFDFAMNVLLQSVHAMLYSVFMVMAFEISMTSIPGFVLALFILNFIFKAEDLFLKIFKFDDRVSSVRENKNYFTEAFKVTTGIAYFSKAIPTYGWGFIKGTAGYLGTTVGLAGQAVTTAVNTVDWTARTIKNGKGQEYKHGDFSGTVKKIAGKVGAGITGVLDDALYKTTNTRSLKLGLGRMKQQDPERYKATKALLDRNKKKKQQVLKRHLESGAKSVKTMAKLIAGIPMIVVDPNSGFTMLATSIGDLKDMTKCKKHYGHMSKKDIKSKRGRVIASILLGPTATAVFAAKDEFKDFEKERKEIEKNEQILGNLRYAEVLKSTINKQTSLLSAQRQLELEEVEEEKREEKSKDYDELLRDTINQALNSVLEGKNIEAIVKEYMKKNKIRKLQSTDIEFLLKDFNLDNIEKDISRLNNTELSIINKLKAKLDELKDKLKSSAQGVTLSEDEKKEINDNIKSIEEEIERRTSKSKVIIEVGKKVSKCQGLQDYMVHKKELESIVVKYMEEKDRKKKKIDEKDIDKIVAIYQSHVNDSKNSYATKDGIISKFGEGKGKDKGKKEKLDRKKSVGAILDSILDEGDKKVKESLEMKNMSQKISDNMYEQLTGLAETIRELNVLDQKNKAMYKNYQIESKMFTNDVKFGEPKKKGKK